MWLCVTLFSFPGGASVAPRNVCIIRLLEGWCITQLQYLLQLSLRTSENAQKAKFAEYLLSEVG